MVILGIDPGSNVTGYGVIRSERGRYALIDAGVIRTRAEEPDGARLAVIHAGLAALLAQHAPDAVAIEEIFSHKSSASAIKLGQARGVALLAAAQAGHEVHAYNPMTVKRSVGAHGKADKAGVAKMVALLLGQQLDLAADATDALAIAVTHAAHARVRPGASGAAATQALTGAARAASARSVALHAAASAAKRAPLGRAKTTLAALQAAVARASAAGGSAPEGAGRAARAGGGRAGDRGAGGASSAGGIVGASPVGVAGARKSSDADYELAETGATPAAADAPKGRRGAGRRPGAADTTQEEPG